MVQRVQRVWASAHGEPVPAIARRVDFSAFRVRPWLHRFTRHGLAGLADALRTGRPRQHDETVRGTVIALARTKPHSLGLSCALWTLARLQHALPARRRWVICLDALGPIRAKTSPGGVWMCGPG